jgi:hypothetical protein
MEEVIKEEIRYMLAISQVYIRYSFEGDKVSSSGINPSLFILLGYTFSVTAIII